LDDRNPSQYQNTLITLAFVGRKKIKGIMNIRTSCRCNYTIEGLFWRTDILRIKQIINGSKRILISNDNHPS